MQTLNKKTIQIAITVLLPLCTIFITPAECGNLEPPAAPGPTMHTLDEIYNLLSSLGGLIGPLAAAQPRSSAYMQITSNPAITGESNEPSHLNWIELLWTSYKLEQPVSSAATGGGTHRH